MEFLLNFNSWYKALPASGKISLFLVVVGAISAGVLISSQYKYSGYQYLYTNLSITDANRVAERLQSMGVEAKIQGDAILVPGNKVLELRNQLASEGLPQGGGVGFELFDKQNFGETEFQQRVNYMRAVQGELARTIMAIDGVELARVHIVIPEQSLFAKDARQPSASVSLNLRKGRKLSEGQVKGVLHMLVTSVEGLTDANVSIIDQNGNILFRGSKDGAAGMSAQGFEIQHQVETRLEGQITELLEKIVGAGGASVKVSASLNLAQVERTTEQIDPESRVALSEQTTTEQSSGSTGLAAGAPGAAANLPGATGGGSGSSNEQSRRTESSATYAVSKTVQRVLEPVGTVKSLSVAVLVDGTYTAQEDGTQVYAPRSAEEIQKLQELVRQTVGFDESRGDRVTVENMQFKRLDLSDPAMDNLVSATTSARWQLFLIDNAKAIGLVLVLGVLFLMLVKLVNSYAPPINVAYANLIGQQAADIAEALPAKGQINIVNRNDPAAREKQEQMAKQLPDAAQRKGTGQINFVESQQQEITIEAPITSEEKLRLQAAKIQTEELMKRNVNESIQVVRSWLNEG
jgi:flagellar M-ring protein FliF